MAGAAALATSVAELELKLLPARQLNMIFSAAVFCLYLSPFLTASLPIAHSEKNKLINRTSLLIIGLAFFDRVSPEFGLNLLDIQYIYLK